MSSSPLMSPRRRRRSRRRGLLRAAGAVLALAALAFAAALALGVTGGSTRSHTARARSTAAGGASAPATQLSPAGLPLGTAPLRLAGVGRSVSDPVQLDFHHPPRAGLLFDIDSGRVLWQRNAALRVPMASLTKMMTALVAVHEGRPATPVLITRQAVDEGGSKVGVLPLGRRIPLDTMLYGLMLPSGNDAAMAIAQAIGGSATHFVALMNQQAAGLGMGCTRYSSPSGFYDAGNFSCAADLAELAAADLAQPRIARVVHTYTAVLSFPIQGGKLYLLNNNPLLIYGYPGTTGMKTGWTVAAGRCLVATAERHGVRLGVVLLNSTEPARQAEVLLNRGFSDVYGQARVPAPPLPPGA